MEALAARIAQRPAKREHGESAARAQLAQGLAILGIKESDLEVFPLGASEKTVLAWWVRERTAVSLRWVSEALVMGH